jgi:hypothetical protein
MYRMEPPSIRASGNKGASKFRAIPIEQALLEKAKHFLESYQFDLRIRQHLQVDKMEQSIGKHKYYILGHEQKFEPGYILVMKGQPVVFLQHRLQFGFTLRLRLHSSLYQNQAIFIGTLDTLQSSLCLEDVLLYEGKSLIQEPFSKRFETLQTFYETAFVQDTRLSNLMVSLAELHPLSSLKTLMDSQQYYSLDFVPEQPNRRRLFIETRREGRPEQKHVQQAPKPVPVAKPVPVSKEDRTVAIAYKIKGMPDTYELKDEAGTVLGKGAVQTAEVSQLLRQTIQAEGKKVNVQWYEEFQRYKILGLVV